MSNKDCLKLSQRTVTTNPNIIYLRKAPISFPPLQLTSSNCQTSTNVKKELSESNPLVDFSSTNNQISTKVKEELSESNLVVDFSSTNNQISTKVKEEIPWCEPIFNSIVRVKQEPVDIEEFKSVTNFNAVSNLNPIDNYIFDCGKIVKTENAIPQEDGNVTNLSLEKILHTYFTQIEVEEFKCPICYKTFISKCNLSKHIFTHKRSFSSLVINSTKRKRVSYQKKQAFHKNEFKCNVCGKFFSAKHVLQRHYITHTNEKPFACHICSKSYSLRFNLANHMLSHTRKRPFNCKLCSQAFRRKDHLTRHYLTHTDEKPYVCDICSIGFSRKYKLEAHTVIHTGEYPYQCDLCNQGFAYLYRLKKHYTGVHKKRLETHNFNK